MSALHVAALAGSSLLVLVVCSATLVASVRER